MKQLIEQYEKRINAISIQYGFVDIKLECILIENTIPHYQIGLELGEHIFTIGIFSYEEAQGQMDKLYDQILLFLRKIRIELHKNTRREDYVVLEYNYDYESDESPICKMIIHKDDYIEFIEDDHGANINNDMKEAEWVCMDEGDIYEYIRWKLKSNYLLNI